MRITYGDLAAHLGVANQSVGPFLNAIYREEVEAGRPDITLLAVYAGTNYGRYNSRGKRAQSIRVDPKDVTQCRTYDADVTLVHEFWHGRRVKDFQD